MIFVAELLAKCNMKVVATQPHRLDIFKLSVEDQSEAENSRSAKFEGFAS